MRIPFMLNCDEFRHLTGAEPNRLGWQQRVHRMMCSACRRFAIDVRRLDRRLAAAIKLDVDGKEPGPSNPIQSHPHR